MLNDRRNGYCLIPGFLLVLIFFAGPFSPGSARANEAESLKFTEYVSEKDYFKCLFPAGWNRYEAPDFSRELTRVYGIQVHQGKLGSRVEISVKYYAKDNQLQKTPELFIKMHAQPIFGEAEEGEHYGAVRDVLVKGANAKAFERTTFEYEAHVYDEASGRSYRPINPRKFKMIERYIVVPAKEGFFVLRYEASPDLLKGNEPVFERVLESFVPQKELWTVSLPDAVRP